MALLFVGMFQHGFAQQEAQPLIQPKMEMHDLFGMQPRNIRPGIVGRAVSLATLRLSRIEISKGTSTPDHNHADEEIVLLLEGSIRAYSGGKEFLLKPGEMITIPAYVQHHYVALTDSVTIEAFGPGGRNLSAPPQNKAP
jgi:quercetin dioxygenase-like cupin family protein